jgi:hypothetical protein
MQKHLSLLGLLHLLLGALGLLAALIVFVTLVGAGMLSVDAQALVISGTIGIVVAGFLAVVSLPSLIAGLGLMARKPWSRLLTLVVSVFQLFNFPFGTALAIYSFWVLTKSEVVAMLEQRAY